MNWRPLLIAFFSIVGVVSISSTQELSHMKSAELPTSFVEETAKINGVSLRLVRGGTEPAIVLIHGFPQDWYEYQPILDRISKKFTLIAVDLRGIGQSTAQTGFDAANMAEDVSQLSVSLGSIVSM